VGKQPAVFVREATGLVRSISAPTAYVFAIANTNFLWSLFFVATMFPQIGTPTDLLGGAVLAFLGVALITYIYYQFAYLAPRTGGDYVWLSRWLHPSLGFISAVMGVVLMEFLYIGVGAITIQSTGFSILLAMVGTLLNNPGLVALAPLLITPVNNFILATIEIWVPSIAVILGTRYYFKIQNIIYVPCILIMLVLLGVMAGTSSTQFSVAFNSYSQQYTNSTNYYQDIISAATKSGWTLPTTSLMHMLMIMTLLIPVVAFGLVSYMGGEMKNTRRTWAAGLFGGSLSYVVWQAGASLLAYSAFGYAFLSALGYNLYSNPSAVTLPALPYLNYLAAITVRNYPGGVILVVLLSLSVLQSIWYTPAAVMAVSRAFFGFSFDRLAPASLSSVSERFNSPINAVLITLIGSELVLLIVAIPVTATYAYYIYSVGLLIAIPFPFTLLGITAIAYPYRFKAEYAQGPIKGSFAGLPKLVWAGMGTVVFTLVAIYLLLTQPIFGANSPTGLSVAGGGLVVAVLLYVIARVVRTRQGIDLKVAYAQIPPE